MSAVALPSTNRLLRSLPIEDFDKLVPALEAVDMPLRLRVGMPLRPLEHVYFPSDGVISVMIRGPGVDSIEAGIIGPEGMTGLPLVLGTDRSPQEVMVQLPGRGHRMTSEDFQAALGDNPAFERCCRLYVQAFMIQCSYSTLANGRSKLESRLARWLLMCGDRTANAGMRLTHEFIAIMLGVRRAGVTVALTALESAGLIERKRGLLAILDRDGLVILAKGIYGPAEAEMDRLFPAHQTSADTSLAGG